MRARSERALTAVAVGSLALLAAGCIGENPVDADSGVKIFALLGGLEVGEGLSLQGAQAERIALPGMDATATEFVIVPFLGSDEDANVTVEIDGAALLDAIGPPASSGSARDG
ncbi:MAG TPA: hypothetical protein VMM35_05300, partial [Longimicrobiales bacterium]|nr:hypothetical protein [Longimicrobiales bacterium]